MLHNIIVYGLVQLGTIHFLPAVRMGLPVACYRDITVLLTSRKRCLAIPVDVSINGFSMFAFALAAWGLVCVIAVLVFCFDDSRFQGFWTSYASPVGPSTHGLSSSQRSAL
ncbi:hypothetical protein F4804DRAFT_320716 [Jackrogersella minutella]|nr:hypothetical protein F4804DRAFT_320716 [Jackrogersella minutella]